MSKLVIVILLLTELHCAATEQDGKILDISDYLPSNCRRDGPFGDRDGNTVYDYYDIDSSDKVASETRKKGRVIAFERLDAGKLNGAQREWHDNRMKKSISTFKNGVMHGDFKVWDDKGNLIANYSMKNGSGVRKVYFSNGQLEEEIPFKDNEKDGIQVIRNSNGRLGFMTHSKGIANGEAVVFKKDGTLYFYATLSKEGRYHGTVVRFTPEVEDKEEVTSFERYINGDEVTEAVYQAEKSKHTFIRDIVKATFTPAVLKSKEVMDLHSKYDKMPAVKIPLEIRDK